MKQFIDMFNEETGLDWEYVDNYQGGIWVRNPKGEFRKEKPYWISHEEITDFLWGPLEPLIRLGKAANNLCKV